MRGREVVRLRSTRSQVNRRLRRGPTNGRVPLRQLSRQRQGCKIVVSQGYLDADNLKSIANSEANVIEPIPVKFQRRSDTGWGGVADRRLWTASSEGGGEGKETGGSRVEGRGKASGMQNR